MRTSPQDPGPPPHLLPIPLGPQRPSRGLTGQGWQEGSQHRSQLYANPPHPRASSPLGLRELGATRREWVTKILPHPQATSGLPLPLPGAKLWATLFCGHRSPQGMKGQKEHPWGPQPVSRCGPPSGAAFEQDTAHQGSQPSCRAMWPHGSWASADGPRCRARWPQV